MPLSPLVVALLFFLAGLLSALRFSPSPLPPFCAAVVFLLWASAGAEFGPTRSHASELLLLAAFAAAGAALGAAEMAAPDCRAEIPHRARAEAAGILGAGVFPGESASGPPLLPLERSRVTAAGLQCVAPVRAILPAGSPPAAAGSHVTVAGVWVRGARAFADSDWPTDGYRAGYLRVDSVLAIAPPRFLRNPFLTLRGLSEQHLQALFPRHFPMVEALMLGRRERLDPAVRERFAKAGLSHLLAISGSHVGILAAVLLLVGGVLRLPRKRITWSTIVLVTVYLVLIGAPASAIRAGAMVSLALLSVLLQRPSAVLPIAAAACLFIVAIHPMAILDVGLQLSFAGVLGIIAAQRTIGRSVARLTRGSPWHSVGETIVVSAAAFVATAPIAALQFGMIAPVAILANIPAIPLTGLAMVGVLAAASAAPLRPVADLLAAGAGLALDLLDQVATLAANTPYGNAVVERSAIVAWTAAAIGGTAIFLAVRRARTAVRTVVAIGASIALLVAWPALARESGSGLEVHFLDVGQGDAIAIRTPRGRWLLVDAGLRDRDYDAGERRIVPFFRARGVTRIEALILTHPHADHIGGAAATMRELRVVRLIEPGMAAGTELYLELLRMVEEGGTTWALARDGRSLRIDGVDLRFLWPVDEVVERATDANDVSAVSVLTYADFSLLLTGDASAEIEDELLRRHPAAIRATVLKAGHRGSSTSTSAEFLRTVQPDLVVISAGRENRYGHPAPDALARIRDAGVEIARTDLEGTISLRVRGDRPTLWTRIGQ